MLPGLPPTAKALLAYCYPFFFAYSAPSRLRVENVLVPALKAFFAISQQVFIILKVEIEALF
jgi:hypothetical protein